MANWGQDFLAGQKGDLSHNRWSIKAFFVLVI
jgi:hypothetical protein